MIPTPRRATCSPGTTAMRAGCRGASARRSGGSASGRPLPRLAVGDHAAADDGEGGRRPISSASSRAGRRSRDLAAADEARRDGRLGGARLLLARPQPRSPAPAPSPPTRRALSARRRRNSATLPGIGAYTSAAIAAIAFDEPAAVVDGNVERVIARLFAIDTPLPGGEADDPRALAPLVPARPAGRVRRGADGSRRDDLHAEEARLRALPLVASRAWRAAQGRQAELPVKAREEAAADALRHAPSSSARADGAILLRRRPPRGLLGGMTEVPGTRLARECARRMPTPPLAAAVDAARHRRSSMSSRISRCGCRSMRAEVADGAPRRPRGIGGRRRARSPTEALPSVMKKAIEAAYPGATKPAEQAPMTEIRHIVFDVGKVLVHYDPHQAYCELIPDAAERAAFLDDGLHARLERRAGPRPHLGGGGGRGASRAIPDKAELIRAFRQNWHLMVSHAYDDSVAILRALIAARPRRDVPHQLRRRHVSRGAAALSVPDGGPRASRFRATCG